MEKSLINQKILAREIESLEEGYVATVINYVKWPFLIDNCKKGLEEKGITEERKATLEKALLENEFNHKANQEALETLEKIIPEVKKLLTK